MATMRRPKTQLTLIHKIALLALTKFRISDPSNEMDGWEEDR